METWTTTWNSDGAEFSFENGWKASYRRFDDKLIVVNSDGKVAAEYNGIMMNELFNILTQVECTK